MFCIFGSVATTSSWLQIDNYKPPSIFYFWHGKKMRGVQNLWNRTGHLELLVQCLSPLYYCIYKAFPILCKMLNNKWNFDLMQHYFNNERDTSINVVLSKIQVN